jgi:micrococcal nuclease
MRRRRVPGPRWLWQLRRRLTWVLIAFVAVPAALDAGIGVMHPVQVGGEICRIMQVIDGDTVTLWCTGQGAARARLTGFDTPELYSPQCLGEAVAAQQAKWALRLMLIGAADLQIIRGGADRYGRSLVALSDGPMPIADRMIAAGHARPYGGGQRDGWCRG